MTQQFASTIVPEQTANNTVNLDTVIKTRYLNTYEWAYCMLIDLYVKRMWDTLSPQEIAVKIRDSRDYFHALAARICDANTSDEYFVFGLPENLQWREIDFNEIV